MLFSYITRALVHSVVIECVASQRVAGHYHPCGPDMSPSAHYKGLHTIKGNTNVIDRWVHFQIKAFKEMCSMGLVSAIGAILPVEIDLV